MGLLDKVTRRFTQTATTAVKTEVKKTVIDLIPAIAGLASTIIGFIAFKDAVKDDSAASKPAYSSTSITTNNYFFKDLDDELIRKIFEQRR